MNEQFLWKENPWDPGRANWTIKELQKDYIEMVFHCKISITWDRDNSFDKNKDKKGPLIEEFDFSNF